MMIARPVMIDQRAMTVPLGMIVLPATIARLATTAVVVMNAVPIVTALLRLAMTEAANGLRVTIVMTPIATAIPARDRYDRGSDRGGDRYERGDRGGDRYERGPRDR